jgi:hypothetical protein
VLIRIADDAPAERLEIRWQAALRICEPLLSGRPWRVVSLAPGLEPGVEQGVEQGVAVPAAGGAWLARWACCGHSSNTGVL